jgi:hypothetical protein
LLYARRRPFLLLSVSREATYSLLPRSPRREPLGDEQQAEIDELTARYEALIEEHGEHPPEDIAAEFEAMSDRIDELSEGTQRWPPEDIAR